MPEVEKASFHALIKGEVQMVGFRAFAQRRAYEIGVTGYVRNTYEGDVEVVAEGEKSKLAEFLNVLKRGPRAARVDKVEVTWGDYTGKFSGFHIRF